MTINELITRQLGELPEEIKSEKDVKKVSDTLNLDLLSVLYAYSAGFESATKLTIFCGNIILKQEQSRRELLTGLIEEIFESHLLLSDTDDKISIIKYSHARNIQLIEKSLSMSWPDIVNFLEGEG